MGTQTQAVATAIEVEELRERATAAGYGTDADAWADGYRRNRLSPALEVPGPRRTAHAAGWIARQVDDRKAAHAANVDGQHDELDTTEECGACHHVTEAELRAAWGDR